MIPDFKKSIDDIIHDRISSPFFGSFLFSWCIWNWRIIYLTIFIDGDKIKGNKIDFISTNYSDNLNLIWGPLLSTLFLILIYPVISTAAYWVSLKFEKIKRDIKNTQESKLLLSIEQSIELREELRNQDDKFDKLLSKKNDEIKLLQAEIESYRGRLDGNDQKQNFESSSTIYTNPYDSDYEAMKSNKSLYEQFALIAPRAQKAYTMFPEGNKIDRKLFDYFLANEIIEKLSQTNQVYGFTPKGRHFYKRLIDDELKGG